MISHNESTTPVKIYDLFYHLGISRQQCTNTFTMVIHFVCFLHCDNPLSSYGKKIDKTREHLLKDYQ